MLLAVANRPIDTNTPTRRAATSRASSAAASRPARRAPVSRPATLTVRQRPMGIGPGAALAAGPARSSGSLAAIMSPSFRWEPS